MWVKSQKNVAAFATLLTFVVIVLGAYTRLSDAGLGCPDWPGCYGKLIVPNAHSLPLDANTTKAWIEMTHRYVAGFLGLIIFSLALWAISNRHEKKQPLILPIFLVILLGFQALLGMWTVTLKLYPIIVLAHLLGGLTTLAGLLCLTLMLRNASYISLNKNSIQASQIFKTLAFLALIALVLQIALGGWTSANYAALVCPGFPYCQDTAAMVLPASTYVKDAFQFLNPSLSLEARMAVHMMHRIGALVISFILAWIILLCYKNHMRKFVICLSVLLIVQLLLGISNVIALLPLSVAVAHNAVAALLLLALVALNFKIHARS